MPCQKAAGEVNGWRLRDMGSSEVIPSRLGA
jgi:hypothetical protein